ncbi:melanin-concentrating hormone receptor 1-like [Heteronotia binoei]|uniref:melanin-concentrating hormone receptor 1-like n=1 Tax=Heteronotia binoei TaxID=13085 RepID=UPI00292D9790|nr:melanin-concentrating hormone receptor 1-like [Heteronotia binoei]
MLAFSWLPGQPHTNTSPPGSIMTVLLDRIHDSSTDFNVSPGTPRPCLLNQSQRDCELGLCCSEGSQAGSSSLGPAISLVLPIIYALICASGVLANGLVISVVLGCKQKVVSDIYILNLAVADLLFLVGMPFIIHQLLQEQGWIFGDFLCWAATTIDLNNQFSSVAIVTLLCIDRYVAVVYSSTIGQKRTLRCTALINSGVWVVSLALATPAMLYARVHWDNKTEICLIDLPGPHSMYWYTLYQSLVAFLLPLLVITVLYSLTLHHLFRAMRRVHRKASARSRKVTRMALTIIAAFFVCWTPYHVLQLVNLTATPSATFFYLYQATICLSYAHSCVSPILVIFCTEFFHERMAQSRYCRFITRRRKTREKDSFSVPEITAMMYSPQVSHAMSPCHCNPFGAEKPLCSFTEATGFSDVVSWHEEGSVIQEPL